MSAQRAISMTRAATTTLAILSLGAGEAIAQDTAAAAQAPDAGQVGSGLEEVVVTAQKRSERAIDVPASLSVIGGEALQKGGAVTNLDLTFHAPGLKMDRNGLNAAPALRGITSLVAGPGLDPNVATYIDGVYSSSAAALLDLPDAESVVVLKGPQGTLFGRNATGGAIQIATLKPSFDFSGNATLSYGRFNDFAFKSFLTGPLLADKLAGSLAAYHETNDGYLHDIIADERTGSFKAQLLRGKLLFTPTENTSFTLAGYYSYHRDPAGILGTPIDNITAANAQAGAIVPSTPYDVATNRPGVDTSEGYGTSLTGEIHTEPGKLTLIAAHDHQKTTAVNAGYYAFAPAGGYFLNVVQPDDKTSLELDFASRQYESFNYIVGLYYYHNKGSYDPLQLDSDVPSRVISIFGYQKADAYSGFGEINYNLTDRLTATVGLRYSSEKRSIDGFSCICNVTSPTGPLTDFGDETFTAWTPRFSLRYGVTDDTNVYFTYSQGFKSGGYSASSVFGNAPPLAPVKPEKLSAYEVGIKSSAGRIDLSAAGYYYDYTNQQVSSFIERNGVVLSVANNAAASTIYGADFEASVQATDGLSLRTGIALTHGRFDSYPAAVVNVPRIVNGIPVGNVGVIQDLRDNYLPRTPDWTISLGGTYEQDLANGRLTLKADVFRSDKLYYDAGNVYEEPAYTNLDASMAWSPASTAWTFTLWGRNLTDDVRALGTFISGTASAYNWAPPRTYGVSVSANF